MLTEFTILMLTLLHEGGSCSEQELMKIARVIQVRAEERKLTIRQVCLQPKQFSCWNGRARKRQVLEFYHGVHRIEPANAKAWEMCKRVVMAMRAKDLDRMPRWNHFYNPRLSNPPWASRLTERSVTVGEQHVFGRIKL